MPLEQKILSENDRVAAELRARFQEHGVLCLNLISSPGSGKNQSFLERTLEALPPRDRVAVLTGDIQTENDANRLNRHRRRRQPTDLLPFPYFIDGADNFVDRGLEQ